MKNEKKKKGGKFPPKGDTTQKRRQSRRREKLNEIAKAHGFASWSAYETAVINGMARLTKRAADGANCPPNSKVSRHAPPLTQTVGKPLAWHCLSDARRATQHRRPRFGGGGNPKG